jgi:3-methyl-2-oxobutanoate hydroxymethyltransferase
MQKSFTINDFTRDNKISMITAYDYHSARLAEDAGINAILIGDSLGMVIQGHANTISVTKDDIIYHSKLVRRGAPNTFLVADMPYMSYHSTISQTVENGGEVIKNTGVNALKLEVNCISTIQHVQALINAQIPVMGHIGLTGQSINVFGGFKVQGKNEDSVEKIIKLAKMLEDVGCFAVVLECIPVKLATTITDMLSIPTIGIGSGIHCNGQILVFHDLLGIHSGYTPRFVKQYLNGNEVISNAIKNYMEEVNNNSFPKEEHCFKGEPHASN